MDVKKGKANLFTLAQEASSLETKVTAEKKANAQIAPVEGLIAEKRVQLAPIVAVIAPVKAPAGAGRAVKAENQMSVSAQRAKLSNQLQQKLIPGTKVYAQEKSNYPVLKDADAQRRGQLRGDPSNPLVKAQGRKTRAVKPTILSTGSGNDKVDIWMGSEGRVHVNVNDKEAWSGTPEKFKKLIIVTGDGDDTVTNWVDGARIETGKGVDTVENKANKTRIDTGEGDDIVNSDGHWVPDKVLGGIWGGYQTTSNENEINTGSGNDTVKISGSKNVLRTGSGDDKVKITGFNWQYEQYLQDQYSGNKIDTGVGDDKIEDGGSGNSLYDPDKD